MKPLQEWICDTCGQLIRSPEEGWVEWLRDDEMRVGDFRICHQNAFSPLRKGDGISPGCQQYAYDPNVQDLPMDSFVGPQGIVQMLSFVDIGESLDAAYRGPRVRDFRNWAETFRRLFLPNYEEARPYFDAAYREGFFGDTNEIFLYLPENLRDMIEHYTSTEDERK